MAEKANAGVHLEAVEEAKNEGREPAKARDTGMSGTPMGKYKTGLLANRRILNGTKVVVCYESCIRDEGCPLDGDRVRRTVKQP